MNKENQSKSLEKIKNPNHIGNSGIFLLLFFGSICIPILILIFNLTTILNTASAHGVTSFEKFSELSSDELDLIFSQTEFPGILGIFSIIFTFICPITFNIALIYFWVLMYQVWRFVINESKLLGLTPSIQTPGKAVGYSFIPFYNLYWLFIVFGTFAKDLNTLSKTKGSNKMMPEWIGMAIPVLIIITLIPFLGLIFGIVNLFILYPIFIYKAVHLCKNINKIDNE